MVDGISTKTGIYTYNASKTGQTTFMQQKSSFFQENVSISNDLSEVQSLLSRLSRLDESTVRFSENGSTESLDDIFAQTRALSSKLSKNYDQSLFTAKALNGTATRKTVSPVADTLKVFQGVLKTYERVLDAIFKKSYF